MAHLLSLSTKSRIGVMRSPQLRSEYDCTPVLTSLDNSPDRIYRPKMKVEGLRSPAKKVAGLAHLGRMFDKIRLHQSSRLPAEYHPNLGLSLGLDGHLCGFLGVDFSAVVERVRQGGADDEIAEWCFQQGLRPSWVQARI